jgi:hypothetical protein
LSSRVLSCDCLGLSCPFHLKANRCPIHLLKPLGLYLACIFLGISSSVPETTAGLIRVFFPRLFFPVRLVLCCGCLALSFVVVYCVVLSCLVLSCLVLSCPVLSCLCLVLSCLVLSCLVLSCCLDLPCLVLVFFSSEALYCLLHCPCPTFFVILSCPVFLYLA